MAGISLLCNEFVESGSFQRSKTDLKAETGLSDQEIDDRLEALVWALRRNSQEAAERIPDRNLWVAIVEGGIPELRVYLKQNDENPELAEWLWIERRS